MSLDDRDWYRDAVKGKSPQSTREPSNGKSNGSRRYGISPMIAIALVALTCVIAIGRDMKDRGVPIDWHGLKWWLSLWLGN